MKKRDYSHTCCLAIFCWSVLPASCYNPSVSTTQPPTGEAVQGVFVANRDSLRTDSIDRAIFQQKLRIAAPYPTLQQKTLAVMRSFIGTPYRTGDLDAFETERLVVTLRSLDCWTSIEACLSIALCAEAGAQDFQHYRDYLRQLRYWGGHIQGYGSRIHYFSGWILQNEQHGYFRDISAELGGVPYQKAITYLTDIPWYYPQLNDTTTYRQVATAQQRIGAHPWRYVPKAKVAAIEPLLQDGDIIALTSARPNFDIEHQGFAIRKQGRVYLLHASSGGQKVRVSAKPLHEYLAANATMSGMMVLRVRK